MEEAEADVRLERRRVRDGQSLHVLRVTTLFVPTTSLHVIRVKALFVPTSNGHYSHGSPATGSNQGNRKLG